MPHLSDFWSRTGSLPLGMTVVLTLSSCGAEPSASSELAVRVQVKCSAAQVDGTNIESNLGTVSVSQDCTLTSSTGANYKKLATALVSQAAAAGTVLSGPVEHSEGGLTGKLLKTDVSTTAPEGDELSRVQTVKVLSDNLSTLKALTASESVSGTGNAGNIRSLNSTLLVTGPSTGTAFAFKLSNTVAAKKPALVGSDRFLQIVAEKQLEAVTIAAKKVIDDVLDPNF